MPGELKIVVCGPLECGKSSICNYLGNLKDISHSPYKPTQGLRIVETDRSNIGKDKESVFVELWDISGDFVKFQECLPAIFEGVNGILFVCEPKNISDLEKWLKLIKQQLKTQKNCPILMSKGQAQGLRIDCLHIFIHHKKVAEGDQLQRMPLSLSKITQSMSTCEPGAANTTTKEDFDKFLGRIIDSTKSQEEQAVEALVE